MRERITKRLSLSSFALALLSAGCVTLPNVKVCSVAGSMAAGMDCAWTLSDKTEEMTLDETITFLEPAEGRAGAVCQSAEDWNRLKTELEKACKKLKCSREVEQTLEAVARLQGERAR